MRLRYWLIGLCVASGLHGAAFYWWWLTHPDTKLDELEGTGRVTLMLSGGIVPPEPEPEPENLSERRSEAGSETVAEDIDRAPPEEEPASESGTDDSTAVQGTLEAAYRTQLENWIRQFHHYPARALRRKLTGTAVVEFVLDDAGHLVTRRILDSSGTPMLDHAAVNALDAASPMPAPPEDVAVRTFSIPLAYRPAR